MPEDSSEAARSYTVGSVARALGVIDIVAAGPLTGITLTELTKQLGTSKSTAYSLARTLVDAGYLRDVQPGPRYRLGMALVRLGDRAAAAHPLAEIVKPVLHDLSRRTQMTARAAINDDGYPMFISRVDAPGNVRFHTPMGVRELPHSSAAGKVILANLPVADMERIVEETGLPFRTRKTITSMAELREELDLTRDRGYGIDDEEDQDGVFCMSAPVYSHNGTIVGALSVTGLKVERSDRRVAELGNQLRKAAAQITAQLTGRAL
ncbi:MULTISPECIES: IclR family transcriptional regulator [unclassified Plantibacter]|uniref:IclR family transcriptional regulator n=1 Tax=unclassified Plantibacter TaxID=2624265 RepID=UPI003D355511